eukprot:COSAG06_NODE_1236_length_10137_cov_3.357342_11_plen_61_part_00
MGELLLAGLSEDAQKTNQMGVEILTDTRSYMYGMRGAHHGQVGYTTQRRLFMVADMRLLQ